MVNKTFKTGTYKINVGSGGAGAGGSVNGSFNGNNSSITEVNNTNKLYDNINLIAYGGGAGAAGFFTGKNGGSGGGGAHNQTNGGIATQGNTIWNGTTYIAGGFNGAKPYFAGRGSGGGGAVEIGDTDNTGAGGDGISGISGFSFISNFGDNVGHYFGGEDKVYFGGGNGGVIPNTITYVPSQGGGGVPNINYNSGIATAGLPNSGGGGGGSFSNGTILGGNGGSGVVIIRFKSTKTINPISSKLIYQNNNWIALPELWRITNQDLFYNNGNVNINGENNNFYKLFVGGSVRCLSLDVIDDVNVYNNINTKTLKASDNIEINKKFLVGAGDVVRQTFYVNNQSGLYPANGMALNFTTNNEHGPNNWTGSDFLKVVPTEYIYNGITYNILLQTQRTQSGTWWSEFWLRRETLDLRRRRTDGNENNDLTITFEIVNGHIRISGQYLSISDSRIKKEIEDIDDTEGLNKILLVQPKTYKYIDETKGTQKVIGFIAQQIKEVIPEAVDLAKGSLPNGEEIEDFNYLNKSYIFTLNVCATQELHRMIGRQQVIIDSLISRIEALEA